MRIGMVAWSFYPRIGGSVTTIMQLSESLVCKGVEVDIIAPILKNDFSKIQNLSIDKRIKVHWVISPSARSYSTFFGRLVFLLKMTRKIRQLSALISVFHAHDFNIGLFSAIIGSRRRPVIAMFGADPLFEMTNYNRKKCINYEKFLRSKAVMLFQKAMGIFISFVSNKKLIIVGYNEYSNEIIKRYHSCPIVNIPVGIDLELYKKDDASCEDIILFVGRFVCWKGLDMAMDVFREVRKYNRTIKMVCIGDGPLRGHYIKKYRGDNVVFILNLDYKGVIEYYKKAKILLVTSRYETFGINISEAMAAGLPIVASDLDVFRDRLTDNINCYLVPEGNVGIFTDRILKALNSNSIRERFTINSLDRVKDYSIDKVCGKYILLYNNLLEL